MNPHPEPSPNQELSDVMKQIAALTGTEQSQALSGAAVSPTVIPAAVVTQQAAPSPDAPAATTQPAPSTPVPPRPQGTPNVLGDAQVHDVVQVNARDSKHHGVIFTIGDIKEGRVHGYRLTEQGGKEFVTVKTTEAHRIGPAKVRSQVPCSRQWLEEYGREK